MVEAGFEPKTAHVLNHKTYCPLPHIISTQKCCRDAANPTPLTLTLQISCSSDGSVGLWDPELGQQLGQFLGHQSAVSAVVAVVRGNESSPEVSGKAKGALGDWVHWVSNPKGKEIERMRCLGLD